MTPNLNVNADLDSIPNWVLALLLALTFAAELLDHVPQPRGLDLGECEALCDDGVREWSPYVCVCREGADGR